MKKLHLGCGNHWLDGWINTDINSELRKDFPLLEYLDVTEKFDFTEESVDYIFSEHLIEHIDFLSGKFMLEESYRVLKSGGKIRICTPDLSFLIDLFKSDKTELQKEYILYNRTSSDELKKINYFFRKNQNEHIVWKKDFPNDTFIINNFVRAWGHKFIYDQKTLSMLMSYVGFKNIKLCNLSESDDSLLNNLENVERLPKGHLKLESFVLEGVK